METKRLTQAHPLECAEILNQGGIVAIPTDTVYGLAVIADDRNAIHHLREVKHRPDEKALAYMVNSVDMIEEVCHLTDRDRTLLQRFLPGPITFIFRKKANLKIVDESGYETLAIRIPNHPFILEMIQYCRCGLYVPSANLSGNPACVNSEEVESVFEGDIEGIVSGSAYQGQASTIVDCTQTKLRILREGPITLEELENEKNI